MPTADVCGVPFKHGLSSTDLAHALKGIEASCAAANLRVKSLRAAIASGDQFGQTQARDWLLYSPEALLTAAVAANRKINPYKRQTLERCLAVPSLIDFSQPFGELVPVRPKQKKPTALGGPVAYRMLHDHGLCHRTAQDAVMRVLGPYFTPRSFQLTHLGTQAAIARAKPLIKMGYVHAARLDIESFYLNFSAKALIAELPLPAGVVEHAVVGRFMRVVMDQGTKEGKNIPNFTPHTKENLLLQARQGIPLGAGSSPIVGMICVSRLAWQSMPDAVLLNYADDFQLLAPSAKALEVSIGVLNDAVNNLPGGHFKLVLKAKGSAAAGIDFLGHRLRIVNGKLKTSPGQANLNLVYAKLNALDTRFGKLTNWPSKINQEAAVKCAAEMYAVTKGWISAFSQCDDIETRWAVLLVTKVAETLKMIDISEDQIAKAVEPWMGYKPATTLSASDQWR